MCYRRGLVKKTKAVSFSDSLDSSASVSAVLSSAGQRWWRGPDPLLLGQVPRPRIADDAPDGHTSQSLCKRAWPERFNISPSRFNEGIDLILHEWHPVVVQGAGPVGAGKLPDEPTWKCGPRPRVQTT